jgi:hypothetical protein
MKIMHYQRDKEAIDEDIKKTFKSDLNKGIKEFPKVAEDFKEIELKTKRMRYGEVKVK